MTELVSREVYPSKKVLDEAIAVGMEEGALETMDLLAELVVTLFGVTEARDVCRWRVDKSEVGSSPKCLSSV